MTIQSTELLKNDLRLLFIGFNPSPTTAATGWNYSGPNNRFYRILHESGLTSRRFEPSESHLLFHHYGYGFTNLVQRPTPRASDVSNEEYRAGADRLWETLVTFKPQFACFVGKGVYIHFARRFKLPKTQSWGFIDGADLGLKSRLFVAPGTSGLVRMTMKEQVDIYHQLAIEVNHT